MNTQLNTVELTANHRQYWIDWQDQLDADIAECDSETHLEFLLECRVDCCRELERTDLL